MDSPYLKSVEKWAIQVIASDYIGIRSNQFFWSKSTSKLTETRTRRCAKRGARGARNLRALSIEANDEEAWD